MAWNLIYGPQNFVTPWNEPVDGFYKSSAHGGADAPIAAYPEFAQMEAVRVQAGAGPDGINAMDVDTAFPSYSPSDAGAAMLGLGNEASGMWDSTPGIKVAWKQFLSSAALADSFIGQVLVLVTKVVSIGLAPVLPDSEVGLFTGDSVIWLGFEQTGGANFKYDFSYLDNDFFYNPAMGTGGWTISGDTCDNAWHDFELHYKPGTVIGPLVGTYYPRAADGYIRIYKDGVLIFEHVDISLWIPTKAVYGTDPARMYGVWHGFASIIGKFTGLAIYSASVATTSLPEVTLVSSEVIECCEAPTVNNENTPGPIEPVIDPTWYPSCAGGGTVPLAADLIDPESWVS